MDNQAQDSVFGDARWEADAPALTGVSGRLRLSISGKPVGVLVVDDGHLSLADDDNQPVDVTVDCASRDALVKLLRGEISPVVAALRGFARQQGDRAFGATVMLGLRAGSPFVHTPFDGKDA